MKAEQSSRFYRAARQTDDVNNCYFLRENAALDSESASILSACQNIPQSFTSSMNCKS